MTRFSSAGSRGPSGRRVRRRPRGHIPPPPGAASARTGPVRADAVIGEAQSPQFCFIRIPLHPDRVESSAARGGCEGALPASRIPPSRARRGSDYGEDAVSDIGGAPAAQSKAERPSRATPLPKFVGAGSADPAFILSGRLRRTCRCACTPPTESGSSGASVRSTDRSTTRRCARLPNSGAAR
jgi:hypothetical protein